MPFMLKISVCLSLKTLQVTVCLVTMLTLPLFAFSFPGMNAAVRAVVRMGIYVEAKVYFIYEVGVHICYIYMPPRSIFWSMQREREREHSFGKCGMTRGKAGTNWEMQPLSLSTTCLTESIGNK